MLSISSGHSADYLLNAVATGRENYYTGAVAEGEPPGRWYGRGAEALGLTGLVDHQDMTALYERFIDPRDEHFRNPERWDEASTLGHTGRKYLSEAELYSRALDAEPNASPERRAELRLEAGKGARRNVAFLDVTFSVPKSITVLHTAFEAQEVKARAAGDEESAAAWGSFRQAVENAIWAGNNAALDYLSEKAGYSRAGHHGGTAGRFVDAHEWTVASFFQHDSRDHDPQLHIHNAVLNRVECADGTVRTLDGRSLFRWRPAAGAVAERVTMARLTRSIGVLAATRPDGKSREVVGVPEKAMALFSSRSRHITPRTAEMAAAYEAKFGREPNSLELVRLAKHATFATRRPKSYHGETRDEMLERWDTELRADIVGGLAEVAEGVMSQAAKELAADTWSPTAVIQTALADVQSRKAAWHPADLTRAISDALPDNPGALEDREIAVLLDTLTDKALECATLLSAAQPGETDAPAELRLANGESAYRAPGSRLYATPEHVHSERVLVEAAAASGAARLDPEQAQRFMAELASCGIELGVDQAAAVRGVLTSGARIESLVGPAGTGKSFVVGALAKAWQDPELWDGTERRVFGLAASQIATDVLTGEGLQASNITRWLGVQDKIAASDRLDSFADWRLRPDDLVVIDESAMASTADLAAVHHHVDAAGAKLLLVGDHRQLAAVGAGGGMELLANAGASYELVEARRFDHEWEREASLRLRAADQTVLGEYHKQGRLLDCGTADQAESSAARAWLADTLDGRRSLLVVDTNEQAARLSSQLRAELVRLGRVIEDGVPLDLEGTFAGVGDLVQARLNGWNLAGFEGNRRGPINREVYRVVDTRTDGGLVVAPVVSQGSDELVERLVLPGSYVAQHMALAYASTAHAGQGVTVDTAHTVVSRTTGADSFYVGMSRGRQANTAHVTTTAVPDDPAQGGRDQSLHRSPAAVLAGVLEHAQTSKSALATAVESAEEARSVRTPAELFADAVEVATAGRTAGWLDRLVDDELLTPRQRATIAAEDGAATLNRALRRVELAGRDPEQALRAAVEERELESARQLTNVLYRRITDGRRLDPVHETYAERVPRVEEPDWQRYLESLAQAADERQVELGANLAQDPPQWAIEAFGVPPQEGEVERDTWELKAGAVAAHRELTGFDDDAAALGPAPRPGQTETYASWRSAWRALDRPEADRDELEMTEGRLRMRVRAYEREKTWAPPYVANELAATRQAAERHRHAAALRVAEAAVAPEVDRPRLEEQANQSRALADLLSGRASELEVADHARGRWLVHTAATRAAADRASVELSARAAASENPEREVTSEQWLALQAEAERAEDQHREITEEYELIDGRSQGPVAVAEPEPDVREVAAAEPRSADEDAVRVPTAEETTDSVRRAQRALMEMRAREVAEAAYEQEARNNQLARWHAGDLSAQRQTELDNGQDLGQ